MTLLKCRSGSVGLRPARTQNFPVHLFHNVDMPNVPVSEVGGTQSIRRVATILRILAAGQDIGVRVTDIAEQAELNRSTVHRMLRALVEEDLAEQVAATRRYVLGREATLLGLARRSVFRIRAVADPYLHSLCLKSGDSVFLTIRSGADSICVDRKTGTHPIQLLSVEIGVRRPLGVGVGGLVLLAFLPEAESGQFLRKNEARLAAHGISRHVIDDRIAVARKKGYAYTDVGVLRGTRAVSLPVLNTDGRAIAAVTVSSMAARLTPARVLDVVNLMRAQVEGIARSLGKIEN